MHCTHCGIDNVEYCKLLKDKQRLDWLQKDERELWISTTCCDSEWVVSEWGDGGEMLGHGHTLREAIDNAMNEEK